MVKIPAEDEEARRRKADEEAKILDNMDAERARNVERLATAKRLESFNPPMLGPRPVIPQLGQAMGGGNYERRIVPDVDDPVRDAPGIAQAPAWDPSLAIPAAPEGSGIFGVGSGGPFEEAPDQGQRLTDADVIDIQERYRQRKAAQQSAADAGRLLQGVDPDKAAQALDLAERAGVPPLVAKNDPTSVERALRLSELRRQRTEAPRLSEWLSVDPNNFDIAHDDTENLSWWESIGKSFGDAFARTEALKAERGRRDGAGMGALTEYPLAGDLRPGVADAPGVAYGAEFTGRSIVSGFGTTSSGIYGLARAGSELIDTGLSKVLGTEIRNPVSQWLTERQEAMQAGAEEWRPKVDDPTLQGISSGLASLPVSVFSAALALIPGVGPVAGATFGGAITAGDAYGTGRAQDMDPWSAGSFAMGQGIVETVFEIPQLKFLVGDLSKATGLSEMVAKQVVVQVITEQGATHGQDFLAWAMLPENKDKPFSAYLDERGMAAYQSAVGAAVGAAIQTTAIKGLDSGLQAIDEGYQQKRAEEIARFVDKSLDNGANSKLLKRHADKYREAVAATTDVVYRVDSDALNELAQEQGVSVAQLATVFRIDPTAAQQAIDGGQEVVIPAGNYVAGIQYAKKEIGIGGEAIHAALGPNIRLNENDPTLREVEAFRAIAESMQAQQEEPGFADAADRVREDSRKILADTKRYNAETTANLSRVKAELMIVFAERTNQDPEKLWADYKASVESSIKVSEDELSQGKREAVQVDDATLMRASEELLPQEFEAWKLATTKGMSNRDIAVEIGGENASVTPEAVSAYLTSARRKGFEAPRVNPPTTDGRPKLAPTDMVIALAAQGKRNVDIAAEAYPERFETDRAATLNLVGQLKFKHKKKIAAFKQQLELAQEQERENRGGFTGMNLSQEAIIRLYESANLSTFVHETAHWYLTTLEKMARLPDAHPFVIEQLASIRNWAGKHPEFEIYDANGQITPEGVEVHEAFAETFEAYMREGKAPSTAMRSVFAAFKSWLMRVYKSIADIGGRVRLNDEIRSVFDRALATDEAIAAARKGMDKNAEAMAKAMLDKGVITQRQYERTKERLLAAREKAEADLMARLMEQYERNQKVWWREEERDVRRDVQSEIDERPEQRAYQTFSGEGWRDTLEDHVEKAMREQLELAQEQGLYEPNADNDTLRILQTRAIEAGLGPLILLFKTTSGRIIAFPGENGQFHHDLARQMLGLGNLKLQHGMYNPRKWPTIEAMNADTTGGAWYATTGELADTETQELAHTSYRSGNHREQVKQAYQFLRDNPEYVNGPLSRIMEVAEVSARAADRARQLIRKVEELGQGEGEIIVYRGSAEDDASGIETGRLGSGLYSAEDPEIGAEWGGATGKVEAYRITGRLFQLTEETAQGIENYQKLENTPQAEALFARLKAEGYVGIRDPWSGHINVFDAKDMIRAPDLDTELGDTWTNDEELGQLRVNSFKAIREASPEDLAEWFDEKVKSVGRGRGILLRLSSEIDGSTQDDIEIKFDDVTREGFRGYSVDMAFQDRLAGVEPASRQTARQGLAVFNRTVAAIKEQLNRTQPDYIVFTGSGEAQANLYDFMLRSFAFEGYEGRIEHFSNAMFSNGDAVFPLSDTRVFTLARADIATQLPITLDVPNVDETQDYTGRRQVSKRYNWTEIVQPESRSAGAPDGGRDQGGGTDAGRDAGAQGELGQSQINRSGWSESGYPRVMPRDLFNEAKVLSMHLKLVDDYNSGRLPKGFRIAVDADGVDVRLTENGELYLGGVEFYFNGNPVSMAVAYNAGKNVRFPLQATAEDMDAWSVTVYDDSGNLDADFVEAFGGELEAPASPVELDDALLSAKTFMNQLGVVGLWDVDGKLPRGFVFDLVEPELGFQISDDSGTTRSGNLDASLNGVPVEFFMDAGDGVLMFESGDASGPVLAGSRDMSPEFREFLKTANDEMAHTGTRKGRVASPPSIPPMRLDLRAVEEQYGPEALAALPPKVRAHSASATDADQFVALARDVQATLKKKAPRSLSKFLSNKRTIGEGGDKITYSGIRDPDGEILAMIGKRNEARGLIATPENDSKKSRSYSYEEAAHAAWEEGFFNGESPPEIAEFLDALRADFDGTAKLYRSADQGIVQQIDNANEWANWFDQNEIDINEENDAVLRAVIETKLSSQTENAIGPDEAAPFFKMADGRALLEGLKQGPQRDKLIREETRRRMIERHGDIFNDGTIMEAAREVAANEVQQRQYEIELEALSNASGKQAAANLARETAKELLRDKQVREVLNYNQWLILSERWGKKALEAAEKGDFAKAAEAKRYQMINSAMFREGRKLAEKIESTRKHLLDYGSKTKRSRLLEAGPEYLEQMTGLLDDYQFRPESKKGENKRRARGEWIRAQMAALDPYAAYQDATKTDAEKQVEAAEALERSQMLANLADGTEAKNFKSITVDELLSVRDEADMIWRLATLKDRLIKQGERRRMSLAAGDIAAEIEANQPNEKPPEPAETDSPGYKLKRSVFKYFAMHRTLQSLSRQFAGDKDNGVFWRYIVRPLNEAFARLSSIRKEMGADVDKLFSAYTKDEQRRMFRDRQTFDFRQNGGPRITLSKQGRLAFALNWGNAKNRQRLMDSLGMDVGQVQQVLNTLDKRDWDFVQASWDYLDTWFPEANRVHESVHGAPMDKEAPLEIATRFGIYRGGYYPIKFDPMLSSKTGQRQMEADAKTFTGQVGARSTPGFTKARVKGKVTLPLRLSVLDVITSHLDQVAVSIATEEALFDAGRLIKQPAVENAIIERHGREVYNTIVNTLVTAKFGLEGANGVLAHLRNGATVVGLGWKVSTALLQPLGISNSIVRVGGFWIAKGYARMGKDAATIQSSANWIMERSEFMRNRRQSNSPEMQALRGKLKAGVTDIRIPGVVMTKGAIDAVKNSAFAMMANTQFYSVDMPTWYGAYFKAQAAGMNEADAVAEADQAVIDSQGGGELHQTAAMQTGAGTRYAAALRLLTNFMSYMVTTYNLSVMRIRSARTIGQIAALGFDLAIMLAVPVAGKMMLDAWTKGGDDDEDELWEKYMREQAAFLLSPFVGISQIAGSTRGDDSYGYRGPAGLGIFAEASRAGAAAAEGKFFTDEGEFDPAFWRPANKTAGMIFHYPASQIDASIRGAMAYFNGETENPAAFLVGPPPAK